VKRVFTDADIYEDEWYQDLSLENKLFWDYICRRAEYGVWKPNMKLAEFQLGVKIDPSQAILEFNKTKTRVEVTHDGRWFIPSWISFQYPTLSENCPAHKPLFVFYERNYRYLFDRYLKGIYTPQEIEKEIRKEIRKEKEINGGIVKGGLKKPTKDELSYYFTKRGMGAATALVEAQKFLDHYETVGWVVGKTRKPMKSWPGAASTWFGNWQEWGDRSRGGSKKPYMTKAQEYNLEALKKFNEKHDEGNAHESGVTSHHRLSKPED
jgi:hypothetical protein